MPTTRTDAPAFSRSGTSHPLGKFTALFPRFKGPEETHRILTELAVSQDMTLAEFIRELCIVRAHGEETVRSMHDSRIDVVAGKAPHGNS
jgi:hypothetical protein